jgi:predicted P-loop ATPase
MKVSLYPNIKTVKDGAEVMIHDIMSAIQEGKWKDRIIAYREKKFSGATEEESELIKSGFPYFTASGRFSIRKADGLIQHSGKLAIDFDYKDNVELLSPENIQDTKAKLNEDKHSEYVFFSCSGNGICVIVNVDPEKHLESFLYAEKYYKKYFDLTADKACKDVPRPRYISFDPELFYNPNYEKIDPFQNSEYSSQTVDSDEEKYEWAKAVHDKRHSFSEGGRHHYMVVLAFWLNKCGVSKEYTQSRFTEFVGDGKTESEINRIVNDCYKNTIEHGQFVINKKISDLPEEFSKDVKEIFKFAHDLNDEGQMYSDLDIKSMCAKFLISRQIVENIFSSVFTKNKDAFGINKKTDIYKIEYFISKRYSIAKNEITHRLEFRVKGEKDWQLLNLHTIYRDIQHAGFKFTFEKLKSLLQSDFVPLRNPIREYFDSLPEWIENEEPDYITELATYIKTDNDPFWHVQFKKALVRNIACTLDYKENRIIMVLVEPDQNTGKTSWIRFLVPPALLAYYTETAMDASKDSDIQLSENMFWNLEELAALHNNEINKLKATISKSVVKQRNPYAPHAESNPRRVNFWASTNKSEFLTDDQNTRWLCFNVIGVDHDYNNTATGVRKININNVWAQAYALYKRGNTDKIEQTPEGPVIIPGYNYQLTKEESAIRDNTNKNYELVSMEKDLILSNFTNLGSGKGTFMSYTDIMISLNNATDNKLRLNIHAVAKAMRQLGYSNASRKMEGYTFKGFWCSPISRNPILSSSDNTQTQIEYKKPDQIPGPGQDEDLPF